MITATMNDDRVTGKHFTIRISLKIETEKFLMWLLHSWSLGQYNGKYHLGPLLLTWFNFNPNMDK